MSRPVWGIIVSALFAIATTVTPIPEAWRGLVVWTSWALLGVACVGWGVSHWRTNCRSANEKKSEVDVTSSAKEEHALKVSFERADNLTVRVVNRDRDREARLRRMKVYGINNGAEKQLMSTDSIGLKKRSALPCVLPPTAGLSVETLIYVPNSLVYGHSGYLVEVELENGEKVRSERASLVEVTR